MMISDLPEDLELEILARVPTKPLVKFHTTCKRWYTLLKDHNFVKKNRGKSAREVILQTTSRVYSISINHHNGIDPSMEFRSKLSSTLEDLKIYEIFQYDGLILCVTEGNTRIDVWNPCTVETRWIKPRTGYTSCNKYALGNSSCHGYKILRFCRYHNENKLQVPEFEIYEFRSDSWRVLDGFPDEWVVFNLGVSLKENAYWFAFDEETGSFLLDFDFTTERFGCLPLPYQSHDFGHVGVLSVVKDERLSLLSHHFSTFPQLVKIWVTNTFVDTKDMSWSNFLVVDSGKFMLPRMANVISFLLDEENKVALCCHIDPEDDIIYILGENIHKEVYRETTEETLSNWPLLVSYVPSLVHIPKTGGRDERPSL